MNTNYIIILFAVLNNYLFLKLQGAVYTFNQKNNYKERANRRIDFYSMRLRSNSSYFLQFLAL